MAGAGWYTQVGGKDGEPGRGQDAEECGLRPKEESLKSVEKENDTVRFVL